MMVPFEEERKEGVSFCCFFVVMKKEKSCRILLPSLHDGQSHINQTSLVGSSLLFEGTRCLLDMQRKRSDVLEVQVSANTIEMSNKDTTRTTSDLCHHIIVPVSSSYN